MKVLMCVIVDMSGDMRCVSVITVHRRELAIVAKSVLSSQSYFVPTGPIPLRSVAHSK